jgi:hypothetical protein
MRTATPSVRYTFNLEDQDVELPAGPAPLVGLPALGGASMLRSLDLIADLRRARAVRFGDPYEWLALRRRRAQIAARRALEP